MTDLRIHLLIEEGEGVKKDLLKSTWAVPNSVKSAP